jgi:hypothetical protein
MRVPVPQGHTRPEAQDAIEKGGEKEEEGAEERFVMAYEGEDESSENESSESS